VTTFTIRVSPALAAHLSSVEMRSWLEHFLRQPHTLPADPGPGEERISLTLPENTVDAVADYSQCSVSAALRRIAVARPGASGPPMVAKPRGVCPNRTLISPAPQNYWSHSLTPSQVETDRSPQGSSSPSELAAAWLIHLFLWLLLAGGWAFFVSRSGKRTKAT